MPVIGSSAIHPGNGEAPVYITADTTIMASPTIVAAALVRTAAPQRPAASRGSEREHPAQREFPTVREGGEVGHRLAGSRRVHGPDEGESDDGSHSDSHRARPAPCTGARERDHTDEQYGPDEIELLFQRERPIVLHRRWHVVLTEVVNSVECENPVLDTQRTGTDLLRGVHPDPAGREQQRRDESHCQNQGGGGKESADTTGPERRQVDGAAGFDFPEQMSGDEVPRDTEEDVDSDVAAREPIRPQVEHNYEHDRECAQSLNLRPETLRAHAAPRRSILSDRGIGGPVNGR